MSVTVNKVIIQTCLILIDSCSGKSEDCTQAQPVTRYVQSRAQPVTCYVQSRAQPVTRYVQSRAS